MRPVDRGECPIEDDGSLRTYSTYAKARRDLIDRMGQYCSLFGVSSTYVAASLKLRFAYLAERPVTAELAVVRRRHSLRLTGDYGWRLPC